MLTFVGTIFGGVLIYVAGQISLRFFIDPYHEYRKIVGEIADALVYYGNVSGASREERWQEASTIFRQKASLLRVRAYAIPCREWFGKIKLLPSWDSIMRASTALIGLSNSVSGTDYDAMGRYRDEIIKTLGLPQLR